VKNILLLPLTVFLSIQLLFQDCKEEDKQPTVVPVVTTPPVVVTPTSLKHPGLLVDQKQIDFILQKIQSGEEPWKSAFDKLKTSKYASLAYVYKAYENVECGSYNKPNVGCNNHVEDGMAVYCYALMYTLTKDARYAERAVEIINAWSSTYQKNTNTNSNLVVSWATPWFVNGAELLKYYYPEWNKEDEVKFISLLDKFLPYILDELSAGNNWIQSAIEAHFAVAVFKDDKALFNQAVERWKTRVKTYIYQTSDGPKPINTVGKTDAQMASIWKSTSTGTIYINGLAMETCRDLGHLNLGFNSMMYAAEIAYKHGVDLYSLEQKRITDFMELHAAWMTGSIEVPSTICGGVIKVQEADIDGIKLNIGGGQTAWDIAYNHFHDRLNVNLPYTEKMILGARPQSIVRWVSKGETLTHAGRIF
jgi:Alginate lyase